MSLKRTSGKRHLGRYSSTTLIGPLPRVGHLADRVVEVFAADRTRELHVAALATESPRGGLGGFGAYLIPVYEHIDDAGERQRRQHDRVKTGYAKRCPAWHALALLEG